MCYLALSASFEYVCYGSTASITLLIISVRGPTLDVRIWRLNLKLVKITDNREIWKQTFANLDFKMPI